MKIECADTSVALNNRRKQWLQTRHKKYSHRVKNPSAKMNQYASQTMPPEYLRKIIKNHGDLSSRFRSERPIHTGALKFLPFAIFKLLENMPSPFEVSRDVKVLYHTAGAITFINEIPRVIPPVYIAQWGTLWTAMRREKHSRTNFKRVSFPPFDAEEPPLEYGDNLAEIPSNLEPIQLELDEVEDDAVFDWLYDHRPLSTDKKSTNGTSYKTYTLSVPIMSALHRLAGPIIPESEDPNLQYMFNKESLMTAKALSYSVPSGPSFEPLFRDEAIPGSEDWTEFNDIYRIIIRNPTKIVYKIALPFVYEQDPRQIHLQVAQYPMYTYNKPDSLLERAYVFHKSFHSIVQTDNMPGFSFIPHIRSLFTQHMTSIIQSQKKDQTVDNNKNNNTTSLLNTIYGESYTQSVRYCYDMVYSDYTNDPVVQTSYYQPSPSPSGLLSCSYDPWVHPCNNDNDDDYNHNNNSDTPLPSYVLLDLSSSPLSTLTLFDDYNLSYTDGDDVGIGNDDDDNNNNDNNSTQASCNTLAGITVYHAPTPFSRGYGHMIPAQNVNLVMNWYLEPCPQDHPDKVKSSYQKLLKRWILNALDTRKVQHPPNRARKLPTMRQTKFFQTTHIDWLEAALQVCRQGYNMLNLIIQRKRVEYLHLDYNFVLKPTRTLTTKERKKSRFGNSFHLCREILRLVKMVVDCHVRFRLGDIDSYQLADSLQYAFSHVGTLTGIYQYKYRTMRQIKACKDLKHLIYYRFNTGGVLPGPGVGFWQPTWRVWVHFMRGIAPILELWLSNLLSRHFEGRQNTSIAKTITKQRTESHFDLIARKSIVRDILDMMPPQIRSHKANVVLQHMSEAWRCWRANVPWKVPGMPPQIEALIMRYIKEKADWWVKGAYTVRERLRRGEALEKTVVKKNLGRLSRLALKAEQDRQNRYQQEGPFIRPEEASAIITTMVHWLESRRFVPIPAPPSSYKHDNKILTLALDKLKESYTNINNKLTAIQKEELTLIERGFDSPHDTLLRIKSTILRARTFKDIEIEFSDEYSQLTPVYHIDPFERITDAYLDQYLWYEAWRRGLFPEWIKPSDREPPPALVYKMCQSINNYNGVWDYSDGSSTVLLQSELSRIYDNIDLSLLKGLLCLIVDPVIADYITAKYNVNLTYKDMTHTNKVGIIRGVQFSSFIVQYYGLMVDILILGLQRAYELAGPPTSLALFGSFNYCKTPEEGLAVETRHPIRLYCRYIDKITILFKFTGEEGRTLSQQYLSKHPDPNNENIIGYNNKHCWPRDCRMRLMRNDVNLGRATFHQIRDRLPLSITTLEWADSFVSVYSQDNPQILFSMLGFEIRLVPLTRLSQAEQARRDGTWKMTDRTTQEHSAVAFVRVEERAIQQFSNRIRHMLMTGGNAPFFKIAHKWNGQLTAFMTYYREAVTSTPDLLELLVKCENKVQTRIKVGINSKMPSRFPPAVFYTPSELGGLGMLSMGHILIPQCDRGWEKETTLNVTHFRAGMSHGKDETIPVLHQYILPWETEFTESERVWAEYATKRREAEEQNRRLHVEDLEGLWNRGLPRINTLFSKDRQSLGYDKGWRLRLEWRKYTQTFTNQYWWTSNRHDGKLWVLNNYRTDVIQSLGGVESILQHTLFKATYFKTWEGVFWEKKTSFEDQLKFTRLTNAQRTGLTQVPNRRFVLWWSPTLNRSNVYIGYQVQLDLTGIFMHGKLPTLKVAYVQVFRAHLWQKIHESLVMDLCQVLHQEMEMLKVDAVQKESIHPRKSYKMDSSCADISLTASYSWPLSEACSLNTPDNDMVEARTQTQLYWIDVQLRWGDYDQHNIDRYVSGKYKMYVTDPNNTYPSATGLMIAVDLAYNTYSAYGNYIPGMKILITKAMEKIIRDNPALHVLRERVRKAVQLYTSEPTEPFLSSSNYGELFSKIITWFIDASSVYRVITHRTLEGNYTTKPINGALFIFNPRSGQFFLKVIHTSVWQGQKRLTQLSKWKAVEEVCALIRPLPLEEQPNQLIVTQKSIMDPLESKCSDFPNIIIKGSDLQLPFQSAFKIEKIGNLINTASKQIMYVFNLYDDWGRTKEPFTCFTRLLLLLRALHVNEDRTKQILRPNKTIVMEESKIWPTLNDQEWIDVERQLQDLILADFGVKNSVSVSSLTQTEIRDIILGAEIQAPSDEREQAIAEIDSTRANNDTVTTMATSRKDQFGNTIINTTSTQYERNTFTSKTDWKTRALAVVHLPERLSNLHLNDNPQLKDSNGITYIIPSNLLRQFVSIIDSRSLVSALLYGSMPPPRNQGTNNNNDLDNNKVRVIEVIVIPPQLGSPSSVALARPISNRVLSDYTPLGIITTQTNDLREMSLEQCVQHVAWYNNIRTLSVQSVDSQTHRVVTTQPYKSLKLDHTTTITLAIAPGSITLSPFTITEQAYNAVSTALEALPQSSVSTSTPQISPEILNHIDIARITTLQATDRVHGLFMVPSSGAWQYAFMSLQFKVNMPYTLRIDVPLPFYHYKHRKGHFLTFTQFNVNETLSTLTSASSSQSAALTDPFLASLNDADDEIVQ